MIFTIRQVSNNNQQLSVPVMVDVPELVLDIGNLRIAVGNNRYRSEAIGAIALPVRR